MSKCWKWFRQICCCCCCCCCCDESKENRPLLSSKESTPARDLDGIGEVRVQSSEDGKEVQEVEVSVKEDFVNEDTPVVLRRKDKKPRTDSGDHPSLKAQRESGTFVRNSESRSSWRLLPTVTQQAREAAAAKERLELEEKRRSAIITSSSTLGDGAIVFSDDPIAEERHVTLVTKDKEEEGSEFTSASVTVSVSQAEVIDGLTSAEQENRVDDYSIQQPSKENVVSHKIA